MSETVTMAIEQYSGKMVDREVHQVINVKDFVGRAIYPWLVMAANPHLSAPDIAAVLLLTTTHKGWRSDRWIRKRRWMVQPNTRDMPGRRAGSDGKGERAVRIMLANPDLSLRNLVRLLKEHGIVRSREWVRMHRCDPA